MQPLEERDYFTDYQTWAAYRFDDMNLRSVAKAVVAADASSPVPAVYLSDEMGEHKTVQWKFHLLTLQRPDLWNRTVYAADPCQSDPAEPGSLMVVSATDRRMDGLQRQRRCALVTVVHQVSGEPAATIFRVTHP